MTISFLVDNAHLSMYPIAHKFMQALILGHIRLGHHNVWSCDFNPDTGIDIIIWISGTRETTSLLCPLILVSHIPSSKTDPNGIRTHDHSHPRQASYHMTTESTFSSMHCRGIHNIFSVCLHMEFSVTEWKYSHGVACLFTWLQPNRTSVVSAEARS